MAYSSDGSSLLGTGGALKKALPLLGNDFLCCMAIPSYLLICSSREDLSEEWQDRTDDGSGEWRSVGQEQRTLQ